MKFLPPRTKKKKRRRNFEGEEKIGRREERAERERERHGAVHGWGGVAGGEREE